MIDITKPEQYMTRCGHEVLELFYYPDNDEYCEIICIYKNINGLARSTTLSKNGRFGLKNNESLDLIKKPVVHEGYINIYEGGRIDENCIHSSRLDAQAYRNAMAIRIACIKITYTEGEGLE